MRRPTLIDDALAPGANVVASAHIARCRWPVKPAAHRETGIVVKYVSIRHNRAETSGLKNSPLIIKYVFHATRLDSSTHARMLVELATKYPDARASGMDFPARLKRAFDNCLEFQNTAGLELQQCNLECFLKASLHSKRPWSNLNKNILHMAYLEQLGVRYDLEAELWDPNKLSGTSEYTFDGWKTRKEILPLLPQMMPSDGKTRIEDGYSIRSASASGDGSMAERKMSFIRCKYEIQTRRKVSEPWVSQIFHGRLERVSVIFRHPRNFGSISNKRRLLAVITPCQNTAGKDAALEITTYRPKFLTTYQRRKV
ncbi:hypothetical protein GGX14DRAFT_399018 [Mycena pura]|uniref:Uncharacterized protein n=1 Tax=Mycena pura TaxID=153505 RepID=A0AAD6Y5V2_9AGAR|nr:hypothetical protein GGX14DRAFT_399018 [Mycena pura]